MNEKQLLFPIRYGRSNMDEEHLKKVLPEGAKTQEEIEREAYEELVRRGRRKRELEARGPLTVGRLRWALEGFEDDVVIQAEGCDCVEDAYSLAIEYDKLVLKRLPQ